MSSNKDIGGQPIPTSTTGKAQSHIPRHWWYDSKETGVYNSSPPTNPMYPNSPTSGSPTGYSSMASSFFASTPPDPKVAIPLPAADDWNKWRRDSLKNMVHLNDFGTD